jgi:PAS domain S-box-containing protein
MSMDPSVFHLNTLALCSFVTAAYLLCLAFGGLSLNLRSRSNQSFLLMCLYAFVWHVGTGCMLASRDPVLAERCYRFAYLGVVFIGPGIHFFTSALTDQLRRNRREILLAHLVASLFALEGFLGTAAIDGVWEYSWGFYPRYGRLGLLLIVLFLALIAGSFRSLIRGLKTTRSPAKRRQIRAVLIAFVTAMPAALDFLPTFGVPVYTCGFLFIASFTSVMFWSIYRYQLMNPSPESLARKVLATIADVIITIDADGFIRMVNPKAGKLLGYQKEDLLQQPFSILLDARNEEVFRSFLHELEASRRDLESRVIALTSRDGELISTSCNLSPILDWKGNLLGTVIACRDMRDIMKSEKIIRAQQEALQETEERYRALFDRSLYCVFVHDFDGNYLDANEAALNLLGYEKEDIPRLNIASMLSEDQLDEAVSALQETMKEGKQREPRTHRLARKDGSHVWVETESCVLYRQGMPYAIQGIARDISERIRAEEELRNHREQLQELVEERTAELRKEEDRFQRLAENMQDVIWIADEEGVLLYVNQAMERTTGYRPEEAVGLCRDQYFTEQSVNDTSRWVREAEEAIPRKNAYHGEVEFIHREGHVVPCDLNVTIVRDDSGQLVGFEGIARDIRARKQAEAKIRKLNEELEQRVRDRTAQLEAANRRLEEAIQEAREMAVRAEVANQAKSEFLANMSHEIRTPMNGVIGMTGLLLETELSREQREYAETTRSSAESLLSVINDILDFSKIEAGQIELEELDFDLRTMVEDMTDMLAVRAHDKGLELSCLLRPDVPSLVRGDPGRVRQVLTNLTGNAIKFTDEGEVLVRVSLDEETEEHATVRFEVIDTGIGIPESSRDRLFKSFSQVDATITRRYGGTGLGLAISKRLAGLMGGRIGFESAEGSGSTFWFTVRLEKQTGAERRDVVVPEDVRGKRILIVDDHGTNRLVLRELLESWGCRHAEAEDGPRALERLHQGVREVDPFRVALIDMQMPGMDGKTLGARIKADPSLRETRLVMLTSVGQRGEIADLEKIGFDAYLTKPVKKSSLYDCLATVLGTSAEGPGRSGRPIVTRHSLVEDKKRRYRILLAEDNVVNQKVAMRILERLGFRADAVADGKEAVTALSTIPYDLVLMDVQMPVMNGFEATQAIRDPRSGVRDPHIPIIAMTAHAMKGDREKCLEVGMNDYISKPVTPGDLEGMLKQYLDVRPESADRASSSPARDGQPVQISRIQDCAEGDPAFEQELIAAFLMDTEQRLSALETAIREEDWAKVEREAHATKGSSANTGADGMQRIASRLEQLALDGRSAAVLEAFDELTSEFEDVARFFEEYSRKAA